MSGKNSVEVSHGRGGAGNIREDETPYADGEIVREGVAGPHGDGAFSTGRGGAANIGSPNLAATQRTDEIAIPETAIRPSMENKNYHVGRGGEGNVHHAPKEPHPVGLADKLKNMLFKKKAKKAADPAAPTKPTETTKSAS